jgi:hypothetical protein
LGPNRNRPVATDGRIDALDTTGDGRIDAKDTTGDGKINAQDTTGDGCFDAQDTTGDGRVDVITGPSTARVGDRLALTEVHRFVRRELARAAAAAGREGGSGGGGRNARALTMTMAMAQELSPVGGSKQGEGECRPPAAHGAGGAAQGSC